MFIYTDTIPTHVTHKFGNLAIGTRLKAVMFGKEDTGNNSISSVFKKAKARFINNTEPGFYFNKYPYAVIRKVPALILLQDTKSNYYVLTTKYSTFAPAHQYPTGACLC